ncbi:MAG: DUF554 domain-containing protein [Oscillospiraceae bacterium]|jgi:uncharacterized membrane protein YqgA involved in biofilm formation
MHGLGTLVNCAAILAGSIIGTLVRSGLPKRFEQTIFQAVALAVVFIGLGGALSGLLQLTDGVLSTRYTMLMVLSLVLGAVIGEALNIEKGLENMGTRLKKRVPESYAGSTFVEGFVTASMLFCVGAMAIVGSLEDGLSGDHAVLFAKSVLDGVSAVLLSASLGFGVMLSLLPVLVYQGGITLLAQLVKPLLSDELILQMSTIGSILIFAIGLNMLTDRKIKVGNLLPAIFLPILFALLKYCFPSLPF